MKIQIIPCLQDNYSYLIIDEKKNIACVIDPSEADPVIKYLENNKIQLKFIIGNGDFLYLKHLKDNLGKVHLKLNNNSRYVYNMEIIDDDIDASFPSYIHKELLILTKNIDQTFNWSVYAFTSNTTILRLNDVTAPATESAFQSTDPTATVQSLGDHNENNGATDGSADTHVSYMFCDVQGFSKIGSFEGNGNANGPFVYTGFRPAFVLRKRRADSDSHWFLNDNNREGFNGSGSNDAQLVNTNSADTDDNRIDFLSNGFKVRTTDGDVNANAGNYIYLAIAESPLVNSEGIPNNAR